MNWLTRSVRNRASYCSTDIENWNFTRSFNSKRATRWCTFVQHKFNWQSVQSSWYTISFKTLLSERAVFINRNFFLQCIAQTLNNPALYLPMNGARIECQAYILNDSVRKNFNVAGFRINGEFAIMDSVNRQINRINKVSGGTTR